MRLKYQNGFIFEGHTFVVDKTDIRNAKDERFDMKEHYSLADRDCPIVRQFLRQGKEAGK